MKTKKNDNDVLYHMFTYLNNRTSGIRQVQAYAPKDYFKS